MKLEIYEWNNEFENEYDDEESEEEVLERAIKRLEEKIEKVLKNQEYIEKEKKGIEVERNLLCV